MIISPSILAGDYARLGETLVRLENSGADWVHIDVMDGHFVNNITIGAPVIKALRKCTSLPFDVHLMISEPEKYIDDFLDAGADIITFHIESDCNAAKLISRINSAGAKASLSVKPGTPVSEIFPFLDDIGMVLIMSVEPGFGGQAFIQQSPDKIREVRLECLRRGLSTTIQVDGGINEQTAALCAKMGADCFAVGSTVFKADDMAEAISRLRQAAESGFPLR